MADFIPSEDSKLQIWLNAFANGCANNSTVLSLTPIELADISNSATNFSDELNLLADAKLAAKAAADSKNKQRSRSVALARRYAKEFKANPAVPQNILVLLGIVGNNSSNPVVPISDLVVMGCSDGVNKLTWSRNTNTSGTIYLVEYRLDSETQWSFAAAATATRFNHTGQIPGEMTWYRVISTRAGIVSVPSTPVVVYGNGGFGELTLAA